MLCIDQTYLFKRVKTSLLEEQAPIFNVTSTLKLRVSSTQCRTKQAAGMVDPTSRSKRSTQLKHSPFNEENQFS
jgi:hypothetical protein